MKRQLLAVASLIVCSCIATADDQTNYLAKIESLLEPGPKLEGPTKARDYLKSLTKDQTLTALRQFCSDIEKKSPVEKWPENGFSVVLLMQFYTDPPRLSDEEFARLPERAKRNLRAGSVPGLLSNDAFDKVIAAIDNPKEGAYFRYALAEYMAIDADVSPQLNEAQKQRFFDTCATVVNDRKSPAAVRGKCCEMAKNIFERHCRLIIYGDDAVKKFLATAPLERRRNLDSLLASGEITLTPKTMAQLAPWRSKISDFRKVLLEIQNLEREPMPLREQARKHAAWLDRSPLLKMPDPKAKETK